MTECPHEDDFTCPVCRAAQPSSDTCRRCRSDLRMVLRARRAARAARRQALLHLAAGRLRKIAAPRSARACTAIEPGGDSRRLMAVACLLSGEFGKAAQCAVK